MANLLIKVTTILSLAILLLHPQISFSSDIDVDIDDDEEYVLDSPNPNFRSRSRFLASIIKKGTQCDAAKSYNICNGVRANQGKSLLYCCKKHCRNILGDRNNCGRCGNKCKLGERCCNGRCTNVLFNPYHCGNCDKKCKVGVPCENGYCGYA